MATVADLRTLEGWASAVRERLNRAAGTLNVQPLGRGLYVVTGGKEPHHVRPADDSGCKCDCGDYLWRRIVCKHLLAVQLYQNGGEVNDALSWATTHAAEVAGTPDYLGRA